ncbi:MAG: hypothetical protein HY550_06605 [Elusimicrobia bacterium]|nr:hypothetical protein [Elusimicrobiota bacterium]
MKNKGMRLLIAGLFLCAAMPVLAEEMTSDEKKLDKASMETDKEAGEPGDGKTVTEKIKAEFGVDDARVRGLRDQKLGYGGITIVLALARTMPEGITDANVAKIMALRQGPPVMGWGKIAKELGLKLGPVISNVKKVSAAVRSHRKERMKREKRENMGRPERPGKPERPVKGGRP